MLPTRARDVRRRVGRARTSASSVLPDLLQALLARLLLAHLVGRAQVGFGRGRDLRDQRLVLRRRLPVPQRLAGFLGQLVDQLDRRLHLLVAEHHGAQHDVLGQLVRFGFDHQHGGFGAGDDEVELRRP